MSKKATKNPPPVSVPEEGEAAVYSYDEVPYDSNAFPQSQPARLAAVASLFGLSPAKPSQARVLELGCSAGGNLIPLAARYPKSEFVGVELSAVEAAQGKEMIDALGLKNVAIRHMSLADFKGDHDFNFVISHGVYSWIPDEIQIAMMRVFREALTENGVGYISYNTYPGWKMREVLRDAILYHAEDTASPMEKVAQAREIISYIQKITDPNTAYGKFLASESGIIAKAKAYYLYHEHLETNNHPCYFKDFMARAADHNLVYLGETNIADMMPHRFGQDVQKRLEQLSGGNILATEQYMDFFSNRSFRQTLLVPEAQNTKIKRNLSPQDFKQFVYSARLKKEDDKPINSTEETTFTLGGRNVKVREPFLKAALVVLTETYPRQHSYDEWVSAARIKLSGRDVGGEADIRNLDQLIFPMLSNGMLDMATEKTSYGTAHEPQPRVFGPARHAASQKRQTVTNLRHEPVTISQMDALVLPLLDGNNSVENVKQEIVERCLRREITVARDNLQIFEEERLKPVVSEMVEQSLLGYSRNALLEGA